MICCRLQAKISVCSGFLDEHLDRSGPSLGTFVVVAVLAHQRNNEQDVGSCLPLLGLHFEHFRAKKKGSRGRSWKIECLELIEVK